MTQDASVDPSPKTFAEFAALRSEIEYRTNAQTALISLNVTAIAALAGFALTNDKANQVVVQIVLAVLCPSLGLLWVDHAITIENIGDYIREKLRFEWELQVLSERRKFFRRLMFVVQMELLFLGPSVAALSIISNDHQIAYDTLLSSRTTLGWAIGASLTFWCFFRLLWLLLEPMYELHVKKGKVTVLL